jgi:hypothetical protein
MILHLFETFSKKASGTNISDFREHIQEGSRHAREGLVGTCGGWEGEELLDALRNSPLSFAGILLMGFDNVVVTLHGVMKKNQRV